MEVTLIAHTSLDVEGPLNDHELSLDPVVRNLGLEIDPNTTHADALAEFSGRACYQSFHKPNPKTRANADYIANILRLSHESVLEHASATFYATGVSRSLTHELIRHRHLSFSELSQRYINPTHNDPVIPPAAKQGASTTNMVWRAYETDIVDYDRLQGRLESGGSLTRKQAREAARSVLPNATETRIVVTGNMRAWRDVLKKRYSVHADAEICEFAAEVLGQLREIAPATFSDFPEEPFA